MSECRIHAPSFKFHKYSWALRQHGTLLLMLAMGDGKKKFAKNNVSAPSFSRGGRLWWYGNFCGHSTFGNSRNHNFHIFRDYTRQDLPSLENGRGDPSMGLSMGKLLTIHCSYHLFYYCYIHKRAWTFTSRSILWKAWIIPTSAESLVLCIVVIWFWRFWCFRSGAAGLVPLPFGATAVPGIPALLGTGNVMPQGRE